ncbi:hypothetical protein SLS63_003936 [Diaporthe eres]|uniref:Uncharacterized protein n=1 Tax=Diaporthe eres TaxID=83184 RepID=A0ABR1PFD3_DIAER
MPEQNYEPSSNDESSEDELDFTLGDLEQFLLHGEPFRHLKRVLCSLVIPDKFMQYILESVLAFLDLVLSDRRMRSFSNDLRHSIDNREDVASDLNTQIRIMASELKAECTDISQLDAMIFLETYSQYISMIAIDQVKDVFTAHSQTFQDLVEHITKAPIPHEDMLEKILADTLPSVLYVDLMSHRKFLANSSAFASFIGALRGLAYPTFFSEATKFAKATIRSAEMSEDSLLAVEGHRLLPILSEMESCIQPKDTSISFSANIIKPEPETFMPGELKFELPADHDDEYHYRPRPTYSAPITKHMFSHYFYGCYDSGTLSHRLHAWMPLAPTCRIRNPAAELLEFVPKRDRPAAAAAQSDKVEVCYGLVARERRSFFRVVVYLCLIMAPALWFVFVWLFVWGDSGDLQDATVPMTLTLAVLSIFWALLYSGSDMRKEYGDGLN